MAITHQLSTIVDADQILVLDHDSSAGTEHPPGTAATGRAICPDVGLITTGAGRTG